eukprot:6418419-Prymnesium_polylepis.1
MLVCKSSESPVDVIIGECRTAERAEISIADFDPRILTTHHRPYGFRRNALFCPLCGDSPSTPKHPPPTTWGVALPVPSGKTTTVQGRQRPQIKAPPENGGMLTEASAGAPNPLHFQNCMGN